MKPTQSTSKKRPPRGGGGRAPKDQAALEIELERELKQARLEIGAVDACILDLVEMRQIIALRIGELKRQLHKPIADGAVERTVLRRNQRHGKECGIPAKAVAELTKLLMDLAKSQQNDGS